MEIVFISVLSGFATGVLLALTGAGGTIVAVPLLTFVLQLPVAEAAPVALLAVSLSSTVGALLAHRQGLVRYLVRQDSLPLLASQPLRLVFG